MSEVRIFHSHIEVYPYEKGECPTIEKMLSKYIKMNNGYGKYEPMAYYIENNILYLPRGINISLLEKHFHTTPVPVSKYDDYVKIKKGVPSYPPKSTIQENAIDFLCGTNDYAYTSRYSQLGLNLDTGDGKTYATVSALLKMKIKAIIFTHQEKLKLQWIKTFEDMTTFPIENLCNISGTEVIDEIMDGKINAEIYCVNHQTIAAYAREHGWASIRKFFQKIKVGIKVYDEAHKFFENIFMIDIFSNVYKTFYLTATFGRSDSKEISIYKKAFSSLARFGEETLNSEEKRKHIIFVVVYYKSRPQYGILPIVRNQYGFSSYKYIDYALHEESNSMMKVVYLILDKIKKLEGKTLILSPKTESVDYIADKVSEYTGEEVGIIHSKVSKQKSENAKEKKIISSTIKSVGEGTDIKGLRCLIDLEPVSSKLLADQVRGRLREYSDTDDTFLFYPVDTTVNESYECLRRILPVMKKKCKEIIYMKVEV